MIAGAGGDDAAGALLGREQRQLVGGAALLERSGALQVLQLEMDLRTAQIAEGPGERTGRHRHVAADALSRGEDVLQIDQAAGTFQC